MNKKLKFIAVLLFLLILSGVSEATVYYVAPAGTGLKDGSDWANARDDLANFLNITTFVVGDEVWVQTGIYYPSTTGTQATVVADSTFNLKKYVKLYGGFIGTETAVSQRVKDSNGYMTNSSILNGNNVANHVVIGGASAITTDTVIDGFTITKGRGSGTNTVTGWGAGMYNSNSSPLITNCIFSGNTNAYSGGGMYNTTASSPIITNCIFSGNTATNGGGICISVSSGAVYPIITNCIFSGNTAATGGGISNYSTSMGTTSPTITNCTFSGNTATASGGGFYNFGGGSDAYPIMTNCTFSGNTAITNGGGIYCSFKAILIVNSIIWGNSATTSSEFHLVSGGIIFFQNSIRPSGGTGTIGNIALDPSLQGYTINDIETSVNNLTYYYVPKTGSPAIGAGMASGTYPINSQTVIVPTKDIFGGFRNKNATTIGSVEAGRPIFVSGITLNKTITTISSNNGTDTVTAIIAPANVTHKKVAWTTNNPGVATVSPSGVWTDYLTATITGKSAGTAIITATTEDGGFVASCVVTVVTTNIPATGIQITPTSPISAKSSTVITLSLNVVPSNATNKNITSAIWTTSDPSRVEISNTGIGSKLITLKGIGNVIVSVDATIGGTVFSDIATLDIQAKNICSIPVTGMTIENKNLNSLAVGKSTQLSVKLEPVHATCKKITWFSEDEKIVKVSETGRLFPMNTGKTKIVAVVTNISDKELKISFDIEVKENPTADKPVSPDVPGEPTNPANPNNPTNQTDGSGKGCNSFGFGSMLFVMALLPIFRKKK